MSSVSQTPPVLDSSSPVRDFAAMGRIGGARRAERARQRKADQAAAVVLATVQEMRAFLERRAGEVEASDEAASIKANAAARLVTALTTLDGFQELSAEVERLRSAMANAAAMGRETTWTTSLGDVTGSSPVRTEAVTHGYSAGVDQNGGPQSGNGAP